MCRDGNHALWNLFPISEMMDSRSWNKFWATKCNWKCCKNFWLLVSLGYITCILTSHSDWNIKLGLYNDDEVLWLRSNVTVGACSVIKTCLPVRALNSPSSIMLCELGFVSLPVYLEQVSLLCCRYTVFWSHYSSTAFQGLGSSLLQLSQPSSSCEWPPYGLHDCMCVPWLVTKCGRPSLPILLKWINHISLHSSIIPFTEDVFTSFRVSSLSYCLIWYIPWHFLKYLYSLLEFFLSS